MPKISTLHEFKNYLSGEVEKHKWEGPALEFTEALILREKELEHAARERDKAMAERDKAMADIDARKQRDAAAADKERVALADELRIMRDASDKLVAKDKAEVAKLQAQLDRLLVLKTEAEMQHDAEMKRLKMDAAAAQVRVQNLLDQEREIKERLAAALGR